MYEEAEGKAIKEMAGGNRSGNIELETRICNSAVQLERMETL
jgi:hypothetical protein